MHFRNTLIGQICNISIKFYQGHLCIQLPWKTWNIQCLSRAITAFLTFGQLLILAQHIHMYMTVHVNNQKSISLIFMILNKQKIFQFQIYTKVHCIHVHVHACVHPIGRKFQHIQWSVFVKLNVPALEKLGIAMKVWTARPCQWDGNKAMQAPATIPLGEWACSLESP